MMYGVNCSWWIKHFLDCKAYIQLHTIFFTEMYAHMFICMFIGFFNLHAPRDVLEGYRTSEELVTSAFILYVPYVVGEAILEKKNMLEISHAAGCCLALSSYSEFVAFWNVPCPKVYQTTKYSKLLFCLAYFCLLIIKHNF